MTQQPKEAIQQKAAQIAAEISQAYTNSRILFGSQALAVIAQENRQMPKR
jgi:hypothetical protein